MAVPSARWITLRAAATRLSTTYKTVWNWAATGKLRRRVLPPSGRVVVDAADVARLARERGADE